MHILEIPSFFPPYGGLFCLDQSKALTMFGNTVRIIANINVSARLSPRLWLTAHTRPYNISMDGIDVTRREMRAIPFCLRHNVEHWCRIVAGMADTYIKRHGHPDILHAHCCSWAGRAAMLISNKHGIPYVITEHLPYSILAHEFGHAGKDAWQVPLLREAYMHASMVVPVAEELVDDLAVFYGKEYTWKYVSNTIDTDFFAYKKRTKRENITTLCCIADFIPRKGYDILLRATNILTTRYGHNIRLIVAGKGTETEEMHALIEKNGACGYVEARGQVDRNGVRDILYHSDCFVLATRGEVQPLVLLEAMCTGIPAVSTSVIPKCERVEGGCLIADVDNPESLCEQIHKAITMTGFNGEALSEKITDMASYASVGKQLTELFSSVCQSFAHDI